jgi:hypothetical protein
MNERILLDRIEKEGVEGVSVYGMEWTHHEREYGLWIKMPTITKPC